MDDVNAVQMVEHIQLKIARILVVLPVDKGCPPLAWYIALRAVAEMVKVDYCDEFDAKIDQEITEWMQQMMARRDQGLPFSVPVGVFTDQLAQWRMVPKE